MRSSAAARPRNIAVRVVRDLRFALVDGYRKLLAGRFVALAAVAAGVLDRSLTTVAAARQLRRHGRVRPVAGAELVDAVLAADGQLSVVVRCGDHGAAALGLRRGAQRIELETASGSVAGVLRLVAVLPDAAADGAAWTVVVTGAENGAGTTVDVVAGRRVADGLAAPLTAADGRLTVRVDPDAAAGVVPDLTMGVRTLLVSWPVAGDTAGHTALHLVAADGPERQLPAVLADGTATATVELQALPVSTWTAFAGPGTPLALPLATYPRLNRFATAHRVTLPADATGPARVVTVGYDAGNRLTVRIDEATT